MNKDMNRSEMSRRHAIKAVMVGAAGLVLPKVSFGQSTAMMQKAIPSTGEKIGVVGLGTWQSFDVGSSTSAREPLKLVLRELIQAGGSMVDSSPMYGSSEQVLGDLGKELSLQDELFFATKVWTSGQSNGISQMNRSMQRMQASPMDLMQIHNLQDWRTHLKTLYEWKEQGKIRYIGITHYVDSSHDQLESIIKNESIDFVQVNYSMAERNAENSLLDVSMENGVGVITNRPYAGGSLFRKTRGKELPLWAGDFNCESWGQFFLKYLISHPSVTCVIPGTSKPHHMKDNVGAGFGRLPNDSERVKMRKYLANL